MLQRRPVWVTVQERQNKPPIGKILRISAAGAISEFLLPEGSTPVDITAGPDCNLWFTETEARLVRISPMGTIAKFPLPAGTVPLAIVTGSDGNLWFTETSGRIGPLRSAVRWRHGTRTGNRGSR